jgi:hypothetical protein
VDYATDFVNPTLRLVHKSFGELLTQDPETLDFVTRDCYKFFVKFKDGNSEIGKRCLTYLTYRRYSHFVDLSLANDSSEHGLLKYASIFWHTHLQRAGASQELFERVRDFLESPNIWTCVRVQSKCAPHMFAKLTYDSRTDSYRMALNSNAKATAGEEFFAHTLPEWIPEFGDQGDRLVRSYHMFVCEWGEVLVRHPDGIQQYFAKVLGDQTFWNTKSASNEDVKVKTSGVEKAFEKLLKSDEADGSATSTFRFRNSSKTSPAEANESGDYIKIVLQKEGGSWEFNRKTEVSRDGLHAIIYHYKLPAASEVDDSDDSDDEVSDSGYECENEGSIAKETSLWFLSVTSGQEETHWYHHISKSNTLQRSLPLFVPQKSLLIWPHDELSILIIDLDTWASATSTLPVSEKADPQLVLQGMSQKYLSFGPSINKMLDHKYCSLTNTLYRASIYSSKSTRFTVKHTSFTLSLPSDPTKLPQILPFNCPPQETTWQCTSRCAKAPISFTWKGSTLYATLGSPKVKLIRFPPLSPSTELSKPANIQILKTRLFIPSSSYNRGIRFVIYSKPSSSKQHAVFLLDAEPNSELPAVSLNFKLDSEHWQDYDPEEQDSDDVIASSGEFLKGEYASKEQAFSVPIRSGLDWRRSVYVTCW